MEEAAGILDKIGGAFEDIWKKLKGDDYKEITVSEENYFLIPNGSIFCRFQSVNIKNESCSTTTYKTVPFGTRCTDLPICSGIQAKPCKGSTHSLSVVLLFLTGLLMMLLL